MAVIYKNHPPGFLLISSLIVLSIMVLIVSFYLNGIMQDIKIAHITSQSPDAYYLAEAGMQEAIWKLQNDAIWKNNFETDPAWTATITRNNPLGVTGSYTVTVANIALANAIITATSTIPVRGTAAERVITTNVFKALNHLPTDSITIFANDELEITASAINVTGGDLFTNSDIDINFFSAVNVGGDTAAVDNVDVSLTSNLSTTGIYDANSPPIPNEILMPAIDFDSADTGSYKSRAAQIYTAGDFGQLLNNTPNLVLNGITYVTGNINIKKGHNVTINGALVADGSVTVGNGYSSAAAAATLDINHVANQPSGLLAKGNISLGSFNSSVTIDGLIYSGASFKIQDGILQNVNFAVNGGIVAQNIDFIGLWHPLNINLNQVNINEALGTPLISQVLLINHWEEEY